MIYKEAFSELILKKFDKIAKKDKNKIIIINKKIKEILQNPEHYKPLSGEMSGIRRAHIGHFVITFEIINNEGIVRFIDFDHHDKIYS